MPVNTAKPPDAPAIPPNDQDAERGLLASILLDPEVLDRLDGMAPDSFYHHRHESLYRAILDAREAGETIDGTIDQVALARRLEKHGFQSGEAFPFVLDVSGAVDTTSQASSFAETVRDKWIRRKILNATTAVQETTRNGSELQEALELLESSTATLTASAGHGIATKLLESRINTLDTPEDGPILYGINGKPVLRPGNLGVLTGPIKSGKTALVGSVIAAPIAGEKSDCLGVTGSNPDGQAVIFFDTEQSVADAHQVVETARLRAGVESLPAWIHGYALVGWEPSELWAALESELRRAEREHGGTFAVILDGVGDMVMSPNDETEAFAAVRRLHRLAKQYDCGIWCVLHYNPGGEKSRGHLGSQLERKAETVLQLQKSDEVVSLWSEKSRGAPILKSEAIRFRYDTGRGFHCLLPSEGERRRQQKETELSDLLREVWGDTPMTSARNFTFLRDRIARIKGCGERTAERRITDMTGAGFLDRDLTAQAYILTEKGKRAFDG